MNRITRRLLAVMLSAVLALSAPCAFAQEGAVTALITVLTADGSQQQIPVDVLVTSAGEQVYWLDMSLLTEEQIMALDFGALTVLDETGAVMIQTPLEKNNR